jgi:hypothetical protein
MAVVRSEMLAIVRESDVDNVVFEQEKRRSPSYVNRMWVSDRSWLV